MILFTLAIQAFGHAVGLMLEMVALLIVIRVICRWRPVPVLALFDQAGRPLVDKALRCVDRIWRRIVPNRPLSPIRLLVVAWLVVSALRLATTVLLEVPRIRRSNLQHPTSWSLVPVAAKTRNVDT